MQPGAHREGLAALPCKQSVRLMCCMPCKVHVRMFGGKEERKI